MKKLTIVITVIFAACMISCGGGPKKAVAETAEVETIELATDECCAEEKACCAEDCEKACEACEKPEGECCKEVAAE